MSVGSKLLAAPATGAAREALAAADDVWIVGGAVRDAIAGRDVTDLDLAVPNGEAGAARRIAAAAGGVAFELSAEFATWRALSPGRDWHVDVARMRGAGIEADLAVRDFTVNAIAVPLADPGAEPLDPHGGAADGAAGLLRAVSERSFADDPLRILRAARLAATLGFELEPGTVELARSEASRAGEPAGERQLAEMRELISGPD
ncbi:MAG: CCA tRNA nucleotidyltransferase, partial [Solirubrobacterales bacterium]